MSICDSSNKYIKLLTQINSSSKSSLQKSPYNKYKKYISTISNKFIKSHNTLLSLLFKIKNNTKFTITYTEISLKNSSENSSIYSIPKFIDIFRYLINKNTVDNHDNDFLNKFNIEEQKILKDKLSHKYTKSQCYKFLDKSILGKKVISVYNSISVNLSNDLLHKFPSLKFHKLLINSFTSYKILEDLELNITSLIQYSIVYEGHTLDNFVYLFTYDTFNNKNNNKNNKSHNYDYILDLGKDIIKRILFFNKFLNNKHYPDKFIIFLTNNKKEIDKELRDNIHFKTININTAVTDGNDIIIYREQELFKSIFHELIHFHNLDFRHISTDILNNIISYLIKTHNIKENNEYLLYECITESLANILNNIYYSGTLKEMNINLQNEIIFSTLQISKILNICKYKKWSEFTYNSDDSDDSEREKSIKTITDKSKQFTQDSCVFSYYILKLYILLNLDRYFKYVLDSKMKFIQSKQSFDYLIDIFDSTRKNILLEEFINSILQGLIKHKNKKYNKTKKYKDIKKTLRMTCL